MLHICAVLISALHIFEKVLVMREITFKNFLLKSLSDEEFTALLLKVLVLIHADSVSLIKGFWEK